MPNKGTELWKREFDTGKLPRITPPNSHASATPASDGQRVFVHFSTLGLIALDAANGRARLGVQDAAAGLFDGLGRRLLADRA